MASAIINVVIRVMVSLAIRLFGRKNYVRAWGINGIVLVFSMMMVNMLLRVVDAVEAPTRDQEVIKKKTGLLFCLMMRDAIGRKKPGEKTHNDDDEEVERNIQ